MQGYIKTIQPERSFCFIAMLNGPDVFAHKVQFDSSLEWEPNLVGRRVVFDLGHGERGAYAANVKAAD